MIIKATAAPGEIVHWYMVWNHRIDVWGVVMDDGQRVRIVHGKAKVEGHTWKAGDTPVLFPCNDDAAKVLLRIPPEEGVPDEVYAAVAKWALGGRDD